MGNIEEKEFDVKKWSDKNSDLAKKSYEKWRKENIEKEKTFEEKEDDSPKK